MTVSETLASVQFVVGKEGKLTGALLDIDTWRSIVQLLEEAEDQGLLQSYLARRRHASTPEEMGLLTWEEADKELEALETQDDATLD